MNKSVAEAITYYEQLYLDTLNKIEVCTKAKRTWLKTKEGAQPPHTPVRYFDRKSLAQRTLKGLKKFVNPQWTDIDQTEYMKSLRKK